MTKAATVISLVLLAGIPAAGQKLKTAEEYNNRGLERQGNGDLDGAIDDYTKAVELKAKASTLATAYNNRANARMAKNDLDGAIGDYGKAIELEPANVEHHYNRGIARLTKCDHAGAIADFSKVLELAPLAPLAYNHRGNARRAMGDIEGAIGDYTKAVEQNPKYAEALYNRGGHDRRETNSTALLRTILKRLSWLQSLAMLTSIVAWLSKARRIWKVPSPISLRR